MVTGTADYQDGFQGLLHEQVNAGGRNFAVPIVKLTGDSQVFVSPINSLAPEEYDFVGMMYSGTNLMQATFRVGGESGTVAGILSMTYDGSDNLLTVKRT